MPYSRPEDGVQHLSLRMVRLVKPFPLWQLKKRFGCRTAITLLHGETDHTGTGKAIRFCQSS